MLKKNKRVQDAVGTRLAHDITEIRPGEFKGAAFRKGHTVCNEDICHLQKLGKNHLYVIDLAEDEIHENEAAAILAGGAGRRGGRLGEQPQRRQDRNDGRHRRAALREHGGAGGLQHGRGGDVRDAAHPHPGHERQAGGGHAGHPAGDEARADRACGGHRPAERRGAVGAGAAAGKGRDRGDRQRGLQRPDPGPLRADPDREGDRAGLGGGRGELRAGRRRPHPAGHRGAPRKRLRPAAAERGDERRPGRRHPPGDPAGRRDRDALWGLGPAGRDVPGRPGSARCRCWGFRPAGCITARRCSISCCRASWPASGSARKSSPSSATAASARTARSASSRTVLSERGHKTLHPDGHGRNARNRILCRHAICRRSAVPVANRPGAGFILSRPGRSSTHRTSRSRSPSRTARAPAGCRAAPTRSWRRGCPAC